MCSRNQPPPLPPPRKKERTPFFLLSGDVLRENSHSKGTVHYLVFFLCVFSQGGKQFFPSYTELARASLPAGIACVAGAINKRLSCNKVIWAREKTGHTRVPLPRPFFLAPVFSFSLRCVLSSLRPQTSGGRRTVLSCAC